MRSKVFRIWLVCIIMMRTLPLCAQSVWENYERFNTQQGLPHSTVLSLLQDSYGYLWIGTYNGLCLYDGNSFKVFDDLGKVMHNSIGLLRIDMLYEDHNKNIWVCSWDGAVCCYLRDQHKFKLYHNAGNVVETQIRNISEDWNGHIWMGSESGSFSYVDGDSIYSKAKIYGAVIGIAQVAPDTLAVLSSEMLSTYCISTGTMTKVRTDSMTVRINWALAQPASKTAFVIKNNTDNIVIDLERRKILRHIPYLKGHHPYFHMVGPATNGGFIYTDAYSLKEYAANGMLTDSLIISDDVEYNKDDIPNCVMEDKNGIIWLGSYSGLYKIDKYRYRFAKYSKNNSSRKLKSNYIRGLYTTGNDLWVGFKAGAIMKMSYDAHARKYIDTTSFPMIFKDHPRREYTTNTFLKLRDGHLLAGGEYGVLEFDPVGKRFIPFKQAGFPHGIEQVWALYEDPKGYLWIATSTAGLYIIHPRTGELYQYLFGNGRAVNSVWNLFHDSKGGIWVATTYGLYAADDHDDVKHIRLSRVTLSGNESENIWTLAEDKEHTLWVGTTGYGLFRMNADRRTAIAEKTFPSSYTSSIVPDADGNLWVSSMSGLYRYDPRAHTTVHFNEQDGLITNDFNLKAFAVSPEGDILLGTKWGMVQFTPDSIYSRDLRNVPVRMTHVRVYGKDILDTLTPGRALELSHLQNQLEIEFAILEFSHLKDHQYRYMLQGFDDKWNYVDATQHRAVYTNIPPGNYHFIVQGSADGKQWSRYSDKLTVDIRPAFWQRPIFWLACGLLLLLCIAALVYYRIRALVRKERQANLIEKQMAALELKALQGQMNPHFIFNTLNAIQHFILNKDEVTANDHLSRFARLMRLFLESSKSRYITVDKELEILELYLALEWLRFEDKFDYEIDVDDDVLNISIPSMLIQPFVENAIVHGLVHKESKGMLKIKFSIVDDDGPCICCTIDDNGIGSKRSAAINAKRDPKHISRGMQLIEERIKTYNFIDEQQIRIHMTDKQPPEEGTRITILIPIKTGNVFTAEP